MRQVALFAILAVAVLAPSGCRRAGSQAQQRPPAAHPSSASKGAPPAPASAGLAGRITVTPSPPEPMKEALIELRLKDAPGKPVSGRKVSFDLTMPAMAMPPNQPVAQPAGEGVYRAKAIFTMAGEWEIKPLISGETDTDALAVRLTTR